ncbi:MAG: penicillin-binding protein activator [Motiliproteus sp.]|nr:penicillin-binding protein activator [Motiliproteus sp.]MCW9053641.1 penicillin-binding protein activator [Motiliproteus sp.]
MKSLFQRLPLIFTLLLVILLQGCETGPITEPIEDGKIPTKTPDGRELTEIEQLLLQAESAAPLEKSEYTLQAAERLFDEKNFDRATLLLESINPLMLSINREQQYWLLRARIANAQLNAEESLQWISRITQPDTLPAELRQILADLEIANQSLLGDSQAALSTLIERSALAADEQRQTINNDIWSLLKSLPDEKLKELQANSDNSYLQQGWYELALTTRTKGTDIMQSSQALGGWQQLWNLHPAATHLPEELLLILSQQAEPLSHIAVLLPQSGKLAKPAAAIIEGILASQFQDQRLGRPTPKLSFYDSNQLDELQQFYLSVDPQQYDLVIGPLSKQKLQGLASLASVPIPTLALNYRLDQNNTENLFQFGLRGEDEAQLAAQRAWDQGHRRALSLTSSASWGQRVHAAFADEWLRLGGELISHQQFTGEGDFSDRISQLLAVDQSQVRFNELRRYVEEKMEFETRRRQDVDFVFLSALARDARQIKPTLAFHYASKLPVYATSHVYSGIQSPLTDQDLNGIQFCDIPWVLQAENPLRSELQLYRQNTQTRFGKLYALGADAYRISAYLSQLKTATGSHLQGQTGRLTIDNEGRVRRYLDWAKFRDGIPQIIQ